MGQGILSWSVQKKIIMGRPREFDRDVALRRAMELFWERGYEAVSLAELVTELGISKPSLYAAFTNKEALFREAVELYTRTEGKTAEAALMNEPTARAGVEAMLRNNAKQYCTKGRPRGCMVVLAASVGSAESEEVRAFLAGLRKEGRAMLVRRVERGKRDGDVSPSADAERIATFYSTVLAGLSVQARDGASSATMNRVIDDALAIWDALAAHIDLARKRFAEQAGSIPAQLDQMEAARRARGNPG